MVKSVKRLQRSIFSVFGECLNGTITGRVMALASDTGFLVLPEARAWKELGGSTTALGAGDEAKHGKGGREVDTLCSCGAGSQLLGRAA